jgi:ElaB/YqjD/DUF883 family membrane-anchored ribosome-binding protein
MTASNVYSGNATPTVTDRAHQAVDKAAEQAAPMLERASSAAHQTIDKVANAAAPAAEWATQNGRQLASKSTELAEACSGYVRERPLVSVAGALALGYLAGRMMR